MSGIEMTRRRVVAAVTGPVLAASLLGAPPASAGAGADVAAADTLVVASRTSPISVVTFEPGGGFVGGAHAAVTVTATLTCEIGYAFADFWLEQGGQQASPVTRSEDPQPEAECTGEPQQLSQTFYGPDTPLRPGTAIATVWVYGLQDPMEVTRTVTVPRSAPTQPQQVQAASLGATSAQVTWATPVSNGGRAITSYEVTAAGGPSGPTTVTVPGSARAATLTGLVPGRSYAVSVVARSSLGAGPASTSVSLVGGAPGRPVSVSAVPTSTSKLAVSWEPPTVLGAGPVTGYEVRATGGRGRPVVRTVGAGVRTTTLKKLAGDYVVEVRALNAYGAGAPASQTVYVGP